MTGTAAPTRISQQVMREQPEHLPLLSSLLRAPRGSWVSLCSAPGELQSKDRSSLHVGLSSLR